MVQARYLAPELLDEGLDRTDARLSGLIQRGRLRAYDELSGLATLTVYLNRGQTATLDNVQVLGDDVDALGWIGYDCLVLCPTGRVHDLAYIVGLANGVGMLYDGLNLRATASETARDFLAAPSVDGWETLISPSEDSGTLTITSIEARLDSVSATTPVIR